LMRVIGAARSIRSEYTVHPGRAVPLELRSNNADTRALLAAEQVAIVTLVKTEGAPVIAATGSERPKGFVLNVADDVEVLVGLKGIVEPEKERARITRALAKVDKDMAGLEKRLASPAFADKAPPEVVAEVQSQLAALKEQRERLGVAFTLLDEF
ncbi:MAG TPA: hypothetical protein VHM70_00140, partial [Polyangiaceae bacterium]|nr:hypothetical protein [Polyangiaceae bacterium]